MLAEIEADFRNSDVDTRHRVETAEKEAEEFDSYHEFLGYKGSWQIYLRTTSLQI